MKQIAECAAGVYSSFKPDTDDGRLLYGGDLCSGFTEYEFEVDAVTGAILDWDTDRD